MRTIKQWLINWVKEETSGFLSSLLLVLPIVIVAMLDIYFFPENELSFTYYYIVFHVLLWFYLAVKFR